MNRKGIEGINIEEERLKVREMSHFFKTKDGLQIETPKSTPANMKVHRSPSMENYHGNHKKTTLEKRNTI